MGSSLSLTITWPNLVSSQKVRPTGVTILAALEILSGIVAILGGLFFATMATMMMGTDVYGAFGVLISGVLIVIGIASFIMAWGLLQGKSWAWTITLILTIIHLIFDLPSFNVIGLVINGIILYYLFRPHVKAYFGKTEQVL